MRLEDTDALIYVAGHRGLLGSALVRQLRSNGYDNLVLRTRTELDLRNQDAVQTFFAQTRPDYVILAAARVGGILANHHYPADYIGDNLAIQHNVLQAASQTRVKRLVFLGSTCIYPRNAAQPLEESSLLTGELEVTNRWYAVAKIAGITQCQALRKQHGHDFVSLMATNLYGPGDNFDLSTSHVLPALMRKFHEGHADGDAAVTVWGTGTPRREFLYSEDMADACLFVLRVPEAALHAAAPDGMLNVGTGSDLSINELCAEIQSVIGSRCRVVHDCTKPDGTPRKLVDVSRMRTLGWTAPTSLRDGLRKTYHWYCSSGA